MCPLQTSDNDDGYHKSHFHASVMDLFQHALNIVSVNDMVWITIRSQVNQNDNSN